MTLYKEDILLDRKEKYNSEKRAERHAIDYYKNLVASQVKSTESSEVGYNRCVYNRCVLYFTHIVNHHYHPY